MEAGCHMGSSRLLSYKGVNFEVVVMRTPGSSSLAPNIPLPADKQLPPTIQMWHTEIPETELATDNARDMQRRALLPPVMGLWFAWYLLAPKTASVSVLGSSYPHILPRSESVCHVASCPSAMYPYNRRPASALGRP